MNSIFDILPKNEAKPAAGKILLAAPLMNDTTFSRSVIYLVEHTKEGSVGLVLNQPLSVNLDEVMFGLPIKGLKLFDGGPVNQDNLFYIHKYCNEVVDSQHVHNAICWGGDFNSLADVIKTETKIDSMIRFFAGYSGWDPGQLDREIDENSWYVADIDDKLIFDSLSGNEFWMHVVQTLGKDFSYFKHIPMHPHDN